MEAPFGRKRVAARLDEAIGALWLASRSGDDAWHPLLCVEQGFAPGLPAYVPPGAPPT